MAVGIEDRGYTEKGEEAATSYSGAQTSATGRGAEQTALGTTAEAAAGTEEERRRAREEQERLARESAEAGAVDEASKQSQLDQLEYLRQLQETGGAQALTATQQGELASALAAQASGQLEGAGQLQLRRALEATQAATAAQLGSFRGMNQTGAQRLLAQQQAAQTQTAAGQSAAVALEEQDAAQKQLAALLGTMRGQDIASQEQMAQQMAAALTTARQQDIASGTLDLQRDQLAGQIMEALRSGDTAALQQAINAATTGRQQDIDQARLDQARELGYLDAQGRVDAANLQASVNLQLQAMQSSTQLEIANLNSETQLEVARLQTELQGKLAEVERDFRQGLLDDQQAEAQKTYWRDLYVNMMLGAASGAGAAAMATATQGRARGGRIEPRGRRLVPGDHPANDVVPAMLSPGEIVLPRSIAQAEDAPEKAASFVRALQREETKPLSRRAAAERIAELEAELAALRAVKAGKGRR